LVDSSLGIAPVRKAIQKVRGLREFENEEARSSRPLNIQSTTSTAGSQAYCNLRELLNLIDINDK